jgi:hypothetical protein
MDNKQANKMATRTVATDNQNSHVTPASSHDHATSIDVISPSQTCSNNAGGERMKSRELARYETDDINW